MSHQPASTPVDIFVARQAIYTRTAAVHGYELLFRSGPENRYTAADGDQATAEVITHSILALGLDQLTGGRPAFINFTRGTLLSEHYAALPPGRAVIELLEDIEPDDAVIDACRRAKGEGYALALDDVVGVEGYERLLPLVDIVKVDFRKTPPERWSQVRDEVRAHSRRVRLLAEKVETEREFERAVALGYDYFQGYFLNRPVVISGKDIPAFKLSLIELLRAARETDFDFGRLEAVIKRDVSLTHNMLRFANAAAHGLRHRLTSVKHALVLLGQDDVVRSVSLLALAGLGADRPLELAVRSATRAAFCEAIAPHAGLGEQTLDVFLLGMFSLVDVLLGVPMDEVAPRLPASDAVAGALLGDSGRLRDLLELAVAYERGDWPIAQSLCHRLGVPPRELPRSYLGAVRQADEVFAIRAA